MTDDDTKRVVAKSDPVAHSPNAVIAGRLREAADLLSHQGANPFRVSAYRRAADTLLGLPGNVDDILILGKVLSAGDIATLSEKGASVLFGLD